MNKVEHIQSFHKQQVISESHAVCDVTLVTAYFAINSKHLHSEYLLWMKNVLSLDACMVIFTSSSTADVFLGRNSFITQVFQVELDVLWPRLNRTIMFWEQQFQLDTEKNIHKGYELYWIWALKPLFLKDVILANIFRSTHFFWVDIGCLRDTTYSNRKLSTVPMQVMAFPDSVFFAIVADFAENELDLLPDGTSEFTWMPDRLAGAVWGGNAQAVLHFRDAYFTVFNRLADQGVFVGKDQTIMSITCVEQAPSMCSLVTPRQEVYNVWFYMIPFLLGDMTEDAPYLLVSRLKNPRPKSVVSVELVGGLGNQLFLAASSYGIASARNASWCIINVAGSVLEASVKFSVHPSVCTGSEEIADENGMFLEFQQWMMQGDKSIRVQKYLQSFRYFESSGIPFTLQSMDTGREWVFAHNINVGIHVRRTDQISPQHGGKDPGVNYFKTVLAMIKKKVSNVTAVVATDDVDWVKQQDVFNGMKVISNIGLPQEDMGILASCPYLIMSIGTFGWWSAYLGNYGNRTIYYYATPFTHKLNYVDHFPSSWISVSDQDICCGGLV